jgi:hypothetical protein
MGHLLRPLFRIIWLVPISAAIFLTTHQAITGFDGDGLLAPAVRGAVYGAVVLVLALVLNALDARATRRNPDQAPASPDTPQYAYGPPPETRRAPKA